MARLQPGGWSTAERELVHDEGAGAERRQQAARSGAPPDARVLWWRKLAQQLRDLERAAENPSDEDLRYIG